MDNQKEISTIDLKCVDQSFSYVHPFEDKIEHVEPLPDGRLLIIHSNSNNLFVCSPKDKTMQLLHKSVSQIFLSNDIYICSNSNKIGIFNPTTLTIMWFFDNKTNDKIIDFFHLKDELIVLFNTGRIIVFTDLNTDHPIETNSFYVKSRPHTDVEIDAYKNGWIMLKDLGNNCIDFYKIAK